VAVAAWAALAWVLAFLALHVYWYLGGRFGSPGKLPSAPRTVGAWIGSVLIDLAFPLAIWACLAIARGWARGWQARVAGLLVWLGCLLLLARGVAGVVDDVTRASGLLPNGITGLSIEDATGMAHPSAYVLWSGRAIDAYFLAGGIVFGVLAIRYRTRSG
jgi:hypothetical protein